MRLANLIEAIANWLAGIAYEFRRAAEPKPPPYKGPPVTMEKINDIFREVYIPEIRKVYYNDNDPGAKGSD